MDASHLKPIITLLMGAAAADGNADVYEFDFIADNLYKLGFDDSLVQDVIDEFEDFDISTFNFDVTILELISLTEDQKLKVVQFMAELQEADGVVDFDEDDYLRKVANGLGLDASKIQGMVINVIEEASPPPLPPKKS